MDSQHEIRWLRAQLHATQQRAERAEQQAALAEQQAALAEQQVELAERAAASALEQTLADFLLACHKLYRLIKPVTNLSTATSGPTTDPTHRWCPERIIPWEDFHQRQQEEWRLLHLNESLWTDRLYPSAVNLEFIGKSIDPIGSEDELRYIERLTLENMVKTLFESIDFAPELAFQGDISFENQARFRSDGVDDLTQKTADVSVSKGYARNIRADQYCVFRKKDELARPIVAVEYKAPHKLTIEEISTGLRSEIWPERDVIDKDEDTFNFRCKNLMAAVITQLFSYMIDRGVQYGYISTGEAFIFGHIPDDPTTFQYSVNIPKDDCVADSENHLERTAVAQVFAFTLQALRAGQPGADWGDRARAKLKRWKVEFLDVLAKIPITERKSREASAYEPSIWLTSPKQRRPYKLRSGCNNSNPERPTEDYDDADDGSADADSPSRSIASRTRRAAGQKKQNERSQRHSTHQHRGNSAPVSKIPIEERPYCTQECLQGLCSGYPVDPNCPNAVDHGAQHISQEMFLQLLLRQINVDRGRQADCVPLYLYGARGALFKVRLSACGYTMVAKGMENALQRFIIHENKVYKHLESLQGRDIPVCCGWVHLDSPLYFDGVPLDHFLITSFSGRSVVALEKAGEISEQLRQRLDRERDGSIQKIRALGVEHGDEADRNSVYNFGTDTLMIIDFDRSTISRRVPLGMLSPNRKRPAVAILQSGKRGSPKAGYYKSGRHTFHS